MYPFKNHLEKKGTEDPSKGRLPLTRLSPEEEEQLVFAKHAKNELEFIDTMNPIHTINSDPPDLHRKRAEYDHILSQRYRKWKNMGLLEIAGLTEGSGKRSYIASVFPPAVHWNGVDYEIVIEFTATVYPGSAATREQPADEGEMEFEINNISRDHPTEKDLPQQVIDIAQEWFENNPDKAEEATHEAAMNSSDNDDSVFDRDRYED